MYQHSVGRKTFHGAQTGVGWTVAVQRHQIPRVTTHHTINKRRSQPRLGGALQIHSQTRLTALLRDGLKVAGCPCRTVAAVQTQSLGEMASTPIDMIASVGEPTSRVTIYDDTPSVCLRPSLSSLGSVVISDD